MSTTFFYAALGEELSTYGVSLETASLSCTSAISLPARVQYVWAHPEQNIIYVVSSDGGPKNPGNAHHATALAVDPRSGALSALGEAVALRARPIHCTVDKDGRFLIVAYNSPSMLTVHPLSEEGLIGAESQQDPALDFDVYSHQVMVSPANRTVIMPARGNDEKDGQPSDTGALKVYDFEQGKLTLRASNAPYAGFGPRHLDFHPNGKWMYLSVERQNRLQTYALEDGALPSSEPLFECDSLARERAPDVRQIACAIHVHPNGRFVYQSNRSDDFYTEGGWRLGYTGEDSLAVYAIDQATGEATPIQHVDLPSIHPRTFSVPPSGRLLVAGTIQPVPIRGKDGGVRVVPAALMVYRIGEDGRLSLARTYEMNTQGKIMFWTGMITLPAG